MSVLVLDRGDIPSLVACAIQNDPSALVLWHLVEPDLAEPRRWAAVRAHAEAWGIEHVITAAPVDPGVAGMAPPPDLYRALTLLQAVTAARQLGCRRIIWPEQVGPEGEAVTAMVDRANLVSDLDELGATGRGVTIELPLIDLTDVQILDLAHETGAPIGAAWPCASGDPNPCGQCPLCQRWSTAFQALHHGWPWD